MDIDKKIKNLNEKDRKSLSNNLISSLYDRQWCYINKIDYVNPNFSQARNIVYKEMFEQEI
jgi:hypothetical protein